jgi:hypothetical protein
LHPCGRQTSAALCRHRRTHLHEQCRSIGLKYRSPTPRLDTRLSQHGIRRLLLQTNPMLTYTLPRRNCVQQARRIPFSDAMQTASPFPGFSLPPAFLQHLQRCALTHTRRIPPRAVCPNQHLYSRSIAVCPNPHPSRSIASGVPSTSTRRVPSRAACPNQHLYSRSIAVCPNPHPSRSIASGVP